MLALHETGSNNPDGVEIKANKDENGIPRDGIPFHPYYTVKDIVGVVVFLMVFSAVVFFAPEGGGYFLENAELLSGRPAEDPAAHRAGLVLHAVLLDPACHGLDPLFGLDAKFWGVVAMGASVVIFAFLPWLDRSPVKSIRYRGPIYQGHADHLRDLLLHPGLPGHPVAVSDGRTGFRRCARSSTSASSSACRGGPAWTSSSRFPTA